MALLLLLLAALPLSLAASARFGPFLGVPISNVDAVDIIPNRYIVVYNRTFSQTAIEAKQALVMSRVQKRNLGKRGLTGRLLSTDVLTFKMNGWNALALEADDRLILEVMDEDEVAFVEADTRVHTLATVAQTNAPPASSASRTRPLARRTTSLTRPAARASPPTLSTRASWSTTPSSRGRATFGANFVNSVVSILLHLFLPVSLSLNTR